MLSVVMLLILLIRTVSVMTHKTRIRFVAKSASRIFSITLWL